MAFWRPTAANYWGRVKKAHGLAIGKEILGDRWARDHVNDKKSVLAAALETAFDPAKSTACIGLDRAERDTAAAWLSPGIGYGASDGALDTAAADHIDVQDGGAIDLAPAELPTFLIDEADGDALNSASVS